VGEEPVTRFSTGVSDHEARGGVGDTLRNRRVSRRGAEFATVAPSATVAISQVQWRLSAAAPLAAAPSIIAAGLTGLSSGVWASAAFGVSRLEASGNVYNMRSLQDINGVYGQVRSGWAIGDQGRGKMWLRNANGVYLKLQARRQGLALSLGPTAW